jgi:hypothetical protein
MLLEILSKPGDLLCLSFAVAQEISDCFMGKSNVLNIFMASNSSRVFLCRKKSCIEESPLVKGNLLVNIPDVFREWKNCCPFFETVDTVTIRQ